MLFRIVWSILHQRQVGLEGNGPGGQWDEAHAQRRPTQVEWIQTAAAMGSWGRLGGHRH
jgi:hypothetical protein